MSNATWQPPKHATLKEPHTSTAPMTVTLVLHRNHDAPKPAVFGQRTPLLRAHIASHFGTSAAAIDQARAFVRDNGLTELSFHPEHRSMKISGTPDQLAKAFGVELHNYESNEDGKTFVATTSEPKLPEGAIAVLGLDQRPVGRSYIRTSPHAPDPLNPGGESYSPLDLAKLYNFPEANGAGQCIGILEMGGGYTPQILETYFRSLGLPVPANVSIPLNGAVNQIGEDADGEVQLDVEVAGAIAPGAKLAVYFAPNTDEGFFDAINAAAHDSVNNPSVFSISWGAPESQWTPQGVQAVQSALEDAAALGMSITVAAGDNSATDGVNDGSLHCDFPASSPSVIACGGTKLIASGESIALETVWNEDNIGEGATGGGVSVYFPIPPWQQNANIPAGQSGYRGRGVPDVSGVADPVTGYQVNVDGEWQVIGGTSAVAPLWAGLIARLNQILGTRVGALHTLMYSMPETTFRDIVRGNNDGYQATPGWDGSTGLGSPNGVALLQQLQAMSSQGTPL